MQVLSCWSQPQAPPLKANEFLHSTSSKSAEVQAKPSPISQAKSISVTPLWFCGKSLALCVKLISGIGRRIFSRCSRISCERRTHAEFHMWPNYSARLYKLRFPHSWLNQSALLIALFPFVLFPACNATSVPYILHTYYGCFMATTATYDIKPRTFPHHSEYIQSQLLFLHSH